MMTHFIPLDDRLLYEKPEKIAGPIVPYQVGYALELPVGTNAGWSQPANPTRRGHHDVSQ